MGENTGKQKWKVPHTENLQVPNVKKHTQASSGLDSDCFTMFLTFNVASLSPKENNLCYELDLITMLIECSQDDS